MAIFLDRFLSITKCGMRGSDQLSAWKVISLMGVGTIREVGLFLPVSGQPIIAFCWLKTWQAITTWSNSRPMPTRKGSGERRALTKNFWHSTAKDSSDFLP